MPRKVKNTNTSPTVSTGFWEDIFDGAKPAPRTRAHLLREEPAEYARVEPYHADAPHRVVIYKGDALEILHRSKSEIFDLIFADPPYFLSNDGITCHAGKMVSVNKGDWDKASSFADVHAFNLAWLKECRRVLKPNGSIFVSGTLHNIYSVGFAMQELEYKILNDICWHKVNPPPNLSCRYFTHASETILWARKFEKARHTFNYQFTRESNNVSPGKQMHNLWYIPPPAQWEKRYGKHPTQKPEALLDRIIRSASNPGDIVLDPFQGSGTTGVVAMRLGRAYVGIELDEVPIQQSIKRLADEVNHAPPESLFDAGEPPASKVAGP